MSETAHIGLINSITVYNDRFKIYHAGKELKSYTFAEDVKKGLSSMPKFLLPKYFYDEAGSWFFMKICETHEYYVTRIETEILKLYSRDIAALNSDKKMLVELGSGSAIKTRFLLQSFLDRGRGLKYIPIDVSDIMVSSSDELLSEYEELKIDGILSEYETGLDIAGSVIKEPKMIVFLGSSIGNFTPIEARQFISHIAVIMHPGDSLLIGFDLVKDLGVLNAAYNDSAGYTARFNLNLLSRINSELAGKFDPEKFEHRAFFNAEESRIEMHLNSLERQDVYIHSLMESFHFEKNETIHTENSYKFTDEMIIGLAESSGLSFEKCWKDKNNYFALCMMKKG